ncbi:hypothetical protein QTP88_024170 [Uroleucon formosanum]
MSFLLSRQQKPSTDECEPKNIRKDLEDNFEVCKSNCPTMKHHMSEAILTIRNTVNKQELAIETLKLGISGVKTDLKT